MSILHRWTSNGNRIWFVCHNHDCECSIVCRGGLLSFSCGKKKSKQRFFLNLSVAAFGRDKFPTADFCGMGDKAADTDGLGTEQVRRATTMTRDALQYCVDDIHHGCVARYS